MANSIPVIATEMRGKCGRFFSAATYQLDKTKEVHPADA
jgi:hypothetical protein